MDRLVAAALAPSRRIAAPTESERVPPPPQSVSSWVIGTRTAGIGSSSPRPTVQRSACRPTAPQLAGVQHRHDALPFPRVGAQQGHAVDDGHDLLPLLGVQVHRAGGNPVQDAPLWCTALPISPVFPGKTGVVRFQVGALSGEAVLRRDSPTSAVSPSRRRRCRFLVDRGRTRRISAGPFCVVFSIGSAPDSAPRPAARSKSASVTCRSRALATAGLLPVQTQTMCLGSSRASSVSRVLGRFCHSFGQGFRAARRVILVSWVRKFVPLSRYRVMTKLVADGGRPSLDSASLNAASRWGRSSGISG